MNIQYYETRLSYRSIYDDLISSGGSIYSVNLCAVGERIVKWCAKWRF